MFLQSYINFCQQFFSYSVDTYRQRDSDKNNTTSLSITQSDNWVVLLTVRTFVLVADVGSSSRLSCLAINRGQRLAVISCLAINRAERLTVISCLAINRGGRLAVISCLAISVERDNCPVHVLLFTD